MSDYYENEYGDNALDDYVGRNTIGEAGECVCGHFEDQHTFAPGGESLCDLCECHDYERKY